MKNNIAYKDNINKTSVIIFLIRRQKLPAIILLLGRTSSEVFAMFVVAAHSFFIFILLLFFMCRFSWFTFAFQYHPSPFRGPSLGFYTHLILSVQPIAEWFAILSFSFRYLLTASATVLCGHFLPTGVFYLTLLHRHFFCVYQGFPGSRQFFFKVFRVSYWSSKRRSDPSVCMIHSIVLIG